MGRSTGDSVLIDRFRILYNVKKLFLGLAQKLMHGLEEMSDAKNCYFVDLFVRVSNSIAIGFYKKLGYTVYRTVLQYYSGENDEDAYDMRKALTMDVDKKSVIPLPSPVHMEDLDY